MCRLLSDFPAFRSAGVLLSYVPLPSEPDLSALTLHPSGLAKKWGFPALDKEDSLSFRQVDSLEENLCEGAFGIREPVEGICPNIDLEKVELILVPGVRFDPETGARLGRGKGCYDRFLAGLLEQRKAGSAPLITGVAFSALLGALNPEPHDVPMDCLLAEDGIHWCV